MNDLIAVHSPEVLREQLLELVDPADQELVAGAVDFAMNAHALQRRKDGTPYVLHPLRVAVRLAKDGYDNSNLLAIALLHDVIEDCEITRDELAEAFSSLVADGVQQLSKPRRSSDYFIELQHASEQLKLIKIYDRLDNLATMQPFSPEKRQQYINETETYFFDLSQFSPLLQEKLESAISAW
ncbi:MAG TPA: HD domain-containing protein [Patescibacteria group bacterium]